MWYRIAQKTEFDNNENDREILDMTGGVKSRNVKQPSNTDSEIDNLPEVEPFEIENVVQNEPGELDDPEELGQQDVEPETFTDYTPKSSEEENQIEQIQTEGRAEDLRIILDKVGLEIPMHDSCRCKIQFRPDDDTGELLIPRWEVDPRACNDCLRAQQSFNQYVEQAGIRVRPPDDVIV
jgi:hypothetical protein